MSYDYDPILHADTCVICGAVYDPANAMSLCPRCRAAGWWFDEAADKWRQGDKPEVGA